MENAKNVRKQHIFSISLFLFSFTDHALPAAQFFRKPVFRLLVKREDLS